eukprot:6475463-Alexandrium_andersonii.AAC.1
MLGGRVTSWQAVASDGRGAAVLVLPSTSSVAGALSCRVGASVSRSGALASVPNPVGRRTGSRSACCCVAM